MNEFKALVTVRFMSKGDEADSRLNNNGVETEFNIWHAKRTEDEMIALLKRRSLRQKHDNNPPGFRLN